MRKLISIISLISLMVWWDFSFGFQLKIHLPHYNQQKIDNYNFFYNQEVYTLLKDNFQVMYFYSNHDNSLYAQNVAQNVEALQGLGFIVYPIDVDKHKNTAQKWQVYGTPDVIFVSPTLKKAIKVDTLIYKTYPLMIDYVYRTLILGENIITSPGY